MFFKSQNITLRALEPNDLEWLFHLENDENYWHLSNIHQPFSEYILKQYIDSAHLDIYEAKQLRLVISHQSQNVGIIDLFDFDPFHKRAGVGIIIQKEFQNNGFGTQALQLLIDYAFNYLKLHQLFANITSDNQASITLFQNLGFIISGTKKEWNLYDNLKQDEHFLQLINPNDN